MPYATVHGSRLYYEDRGTGRPLVFLHGWGTSGRVWDAQVADLAADHRTITVDWRGCGRSDRPRSGNTLAGNAADVLALVETLGLDTPVLVGSSVAAHFVVLAAQAAPGRLGGIVSVDGPGHWPTLGMAAELADLRVRLAADRAATAAEWVPTWYGPAAGPRVHARTVERILASGTFIDALFTEVGGFDPRPIVTGLDLPAAFVHGGLETQFPLEVSRTLAGLAPQGRLYVVDGAGHMPHEERPEAFNTVLRTALSEMAPALG